MKPETQLVRVGVGRAPLTGAIALPIYQTVTFKHQAFHRGSGYDYSRTQNPTRQALEEGMADIEGGARAAAYASGMAALTAFFHLFRPGDHLVATEDLYGGTYRLLTGLFEELGLACTFVDTSDLAAVRRAITARTVALVVETPTNPLLKIADLGALATVAHDANALLLVDNTFMTPYLQKPITLGADFVVYSASKYLSGHNDVLAGILVARDPAWGERIAYLQNATGAVLGPQDAWLTVRGIKTLAVRMDRHVQNAQVVARFLDDHPQVERVYYPGLLRHPGRSVHLTQASASPGGMLSFLLRKPDQVEQVLSRLELVIFAESLGGTETLVTHPANQTHRDLPAEMRERLGIVPGLLRLSVGLEDPEDIMADLDQALRG